MKKLLLSAMLVAASLVSVSAQSAVTLSYNYAVDANSGKKSAYQNVYVETFDLAGGGCGLVNAGPGPATVVGGPFGFAQGSSGVSAAPYKDTTCYAYGPGNIFIPEFPGQTPPASPNASIRIDYTGLINASQGTGGVLDYFGLYYGSIDEYNQLEFFNGDTLVATVTGTSILAGCQPLGCKAGDQFSDDTNIFVNVMFGPGSGFNNIRFSTTGVAVEVDNLTVGKLPEPTSLALVGLALAGLGFAARRRKV